MKLKVEIASFTNLNQIIDFLSKEEKTCITLMSRFIQNDKIAFLPNYIKGYLIFDNKTLIGFLAISDGGIVLHHFDKEIFESNDDYLANLAKLIYPILNRHNIYSIVGDYCGTDFLRKTMEKKKKPKIQIPYTLMIYDKTKKEDLSELSNDFMLKKCTKEDTDFLFGLQAAYDMVEVLPPGEKFNPDNCRLNLRHNLGCQYIIGIQDKSDNKFVAKAGTNAIGLNWVQLGGVFTKEEFRGRGFATFLVKKMAFIMTEKQKNVALFVKDSNDFAKKAYIKAGFEPDSRFSICYY